MGLWHLLTVADLSWQPSAVTSVVAQIVPEPTTDPVAVFLIILAIMLVAPLIVERLRMPGIIGLILAGVIVGPHGLGVLERDNTITLLGTVGLLFLMFLGGLETSLDDLKRNADKALIFGLATFAVPMVIGTAVMLPLGYSLLASVLVASCLASHTLVALPLLSKLGIMRTQTATATLGATLITNILALLVLAVVVKANQGDLTLGFWLLLIPSLAVYTFAVLWGVPNLGRWFFRRFGHDESAEFTFVLAALFVVSYLANLIEIEPIVGAFLAGVAITQIVPRLSPLMNRIQFIGNTLFVPFFLISVGMLVDPLILIREPRSLVVAGIIIVAEVGSKFVAAWGSARWFGWAFSNGMVMFGLSVAQAASTLAAITVAFDIDLVDELAVNGTIAMILVSCVLSPWVVARWGNKMETQPEAEKGQPVTAEATQVALGQRVVVPVANPSTEDNLLQLAVILTKRVKGTLLPLHVLVDRNAPVTPHDRMRQRQLLDAAEEIAHAATIPVEAVGRIDDAIDGGIIRTVQERDADLLICGWKGFSTYRENFFGSVIDNIVRSASVPVLVTRFPQPIQNTRQIVFAITGQRIRMLHIRKTLLIARSLAEELKAPLQILQIVPDTFRGKNFAPLVEDTEIELIRTSGNPVRRVSEALEPDSLLILVENTYRVGQPALGREPEAIARAKWETNMIIVHFPETPRSRSAQSANG
ncbi:MAG: cation:proton antiporter [Leptolyngbyaceae cyanobacterium T60_A2020_046]|nr:cation:proton antiporter [Leptolyngbyaceae cyanobacterium T60_A2020_046]